MRFGTSHVRLPTRFCVPTLSRKQNDPYIAGPRCTEASWFSGRRGDRGGEEGYWLRAGVDGGQAVDGVSLEAQTAKIEAWCRVNEFDLTGLFVDAGVSGKRADNRPELQKALISVTGCRGALVVYSLSRLARSTKDTIQISERLDKSGADLVSLSERIDTTSAAGRMVFQMLAVLAEFERNQISERTKAAMAHMRSQGRFTGQVPFGFDLHSDGETLVPNEEESAVIQSIVSWRGDGLSLRGIANRLQERGIRTKSGNHDWTHTTVKSILGRSAGCK